MHLIGLTGGIASGKSTVSKILENDYGAYIIDADKISKELSEPGQLIHSALALSFTAEGTYNLYFNKDNTLNRRALGNKMFSDPIYKKEIEAMMHRTIVREINMHIAQSFIDKRDLVVIDAPLLIEVGLHEHVNKLIVVDINPTLQLERLVKRNNFTQEEALLRIKSQMDAQERLSYADYILDNNGTDDEIKGKLNIIIQDILNS